MIKPLWSLPRSEASREYQLAVVAMDLPLSSRSLGDQAPSGQGRLSPNSIFPTLVLIRVGGGVGEAQPPRPSQRPWTEPLRLRVYDLSPPCPLHSAFGTRPSSAGSPPSYAGYFPNSIFPTSCPHKGWGWCG